MSGSAAGFDRLVLGAFGRRIAVTGPAEALQATRDRLPPDYQVTEGTAEREWTYSVEGDQRWTVTVGGDAIVTGRELTQAIVYGLSDLEIWVGEHAEQLIFIHAGSVVHRGRAIILPGHSMFGKTTLTLALVAAGATYFSDEYAVFDRAGMVHPYRRRPSVRRPGSGLAPGPTIDDPGGTNQAQPVPLAIAARLTYDAHQGWAVEARTRSQGVLATMEHALAAQSRGAEVLDALASASAEARFLSGTRGDAAAAADRLLELCE